ncbi:PAI1 inhibitor, partial [Oxylabes madagascariensis]|nr:PAI1 inhibitor [Oxylabes madagascariensis]
DTPDPSQVPELVTDLGLRLFRAALAPRGDANAAFAPYGAASLLLALQVATAGGARRQLEEATGFSVDGEG